MSVPNVTFAATMVSQSIVIEGRLPDNTVASELADLNLSFYDTAEEGSVIKNYDLTGTGTITLDSSNTTELGNQVYYAELTTMDETYVSSDRVAIDFATFNGVVSIALKDKPVEPEPVEDPAEPVEDPAEPVEDPAEPVEDPAEPVEDPAEPVEDPAEPIEDPAEPVEDPAEPVEDPAEPVEDPAEPVEDPAEPVEDPAEPVEDPSLTLEGDVFLVETNYVDYFVDEGSVRVDVKLDGTTDTDFSHYSFVLKDTSSNEYILDDFHWTNINLEDTFVRIAFEAKTDGFNLTSGSYTVDITYDNTIDTPVSLDTPISFELIDGALIEGMSYFGTDGSNNYYKLHGRNMDSNVTQAEIFNSSDLSLGMATIGVLNAAWGSYYLAVPTSYADADYFTVSGVTFMNDNSDHVYVDAGSRNVEMRVEQINGDNVIKLFNSNIDEGELTSIIVNINGNDVDFINDPETTVSNFTDELSGGIEIIIPKNDTYEDGPYEVEWTLTYLDSESNTQYQTERSGDYEFVFKASLVTFNVYDSNNVLLDDFRASWNYKSDGADINYSTSGSQLLVSTESADGEYDVMVASLTGTDSFSTLFAFKIESGVALDGNGTPLVGEQRIDVRSGLLAGEALGIDGNVTTEAEVRYRIRESNDWNWIGNAEPKPDGKFYLPPVDGTYLIELEPYDENAFLASSEYTVSNGSVGYNDLQLEPVKLKGYILDPEGNRIDNGDFDLHITGSNGDTFASYSYHVEGELAYKAGNLPEGDYEVIAFPRGNLEDLDYYPSESYTITITSDVLNKDLQFRTADEVPYEIAHNDSVYSPESDDYFMIRLRLSGIDDENASNYSFRLTDSSNVVYDVTDYHWLEVYNEDGYLNIRSDVWLDGHFLAKGPYTLEVIHTTKGTLSTDITVTDQPILEGFEYFGFETVTEQSGEVTYHYFKIYERELRESGNDVFVYDSSDNQVGSGSVIQLEEDNNILYAKVTYTGSPSYMVIDGVIAQNDDADNWDINTSTQFSETKVTQNALGNVIKLYNSYNQPDDLNGLVLIKENQTIDLLTSPGVVVTRFDDDMTGGLMITVPYRSDLDDDRYRVEWEFSNYSGSTGDFYFIFKAPIQVFNLEASDGSELFEYQIEMSNQSDGADINYVHSGNKLYISTETTDGDYAVIVSSTDESRTDSFSELFKFTVTGGVAYYRADDGGASVETDKTLQVRAGVLAGHSLQNGSDPAENGYLDVRIIYDNENSDWFGRMALRSNSEFYLPTDDATYEVTLRSDDVNVLYSDRHTYEISNGAVTSADLEYSAVQIKGILRDKNNVKLTDHEFRVEIEKDDDYYEMDIYNNNGEFYFVTGNLPAGTYNITVIPEGHYADEGNMSSATEEVILPNNGIVNLDIRFRSESEVPFGLDYNHAQVISGKYDFLHFDLTLTGTTETDINQYVLQLFDGQDLVYTLNNYHWVDSGMDNGKLSLRGSSDLTQILESKSYTLKITYEGQEVSTPVEVTDEPILERLNFIGAVNIENTDYYTHYYRIDINNNPDGDYALTAYNSADEDISSDPEPNVDPVIEPGSAYMFYEPHQNYIAQFTTNEIPSYVTIDDLRYQSPDSGRIYEEGWLYEVFTTVETKFDGNYIRFYNTKVTPDMLQYFKIEINGEKIEFLGRDLVTVTTFDDLTGGIEVFIPFDETLESGDYTMSFELLSEDGNDSFSTDRGDYRFNFAAPLMTFIIIDSNDEALNEYASMFSYESEDGHLNYSKDGNEVVIADDAHDGDYAVTIIPEGNSDVFSDKYNFKILNGIPYDSEDNEITSAVSLQTREGILAGTTKNTDGSTATSSYLSIRQLVENDEYEWISNSLVQESGNYYLPTADASYYIELRPYYSETDVSPVMAYVEVKDGAVVETKALQLVETQVKGKILSPSGEELSERDVEIIVTDADDNEYLAQTYSYNDVLYYRMGGLVEGEYMVVIRPDGYFTDLGYGSSLTLDVSVDSSGVATPSETDILLRNIEETSLLTVELRQASSQPYTSHLDVTNYGDEAEYQVQISNGKAYFTGFEDGHYEMLLHDYDDQNKRLISSEYISLDVENNLVTYNGNIVTNLTKVIEERPKQLSVLGKYPDGSLIPAEKMGTVLRTSDNVYPWPRFYADEDGRDTYYLLPAGSYNVRETEIDGDFASSDVQEFTVNPDGSSTLNPALLDLTLNEAIITGTVQLSDGSLIPVDVYMIVRLYINGVEDDPLQYRISGVNEEGHFYFADIPQGSHTIMVSTKEDSYCDGDMITIEYTGDAIVIADPVIIYTVYEVLEDLRTYATTLVNEGLTDETLADINSTVDTYSGLIESSDKTEMNTAIDAIITTIEGGLIKNPTPSLVSDTPTKDTVEITIDLNFTPTDNHKTFYKIDGEWVEFTNQFEVSENAEYWVKTVYDNEEYEFTSEAVSIIVTTIDRSAPVLSLTGDKVVEVPYGQDYTDAGYLVFDNVSGANAITVTPTSDVNTDVIGDYTYTYTAEDEAGNTTTKDRIVKVVDSVDPTIKLTTTTNVNLTEAEEVVGTTVTFKVVAADEIDSSPDVEVRLNGDVLTAVEGVYEGTLILGDNFVVAKVIDDSGNDAQAVMVVCNYAIDIDASTNELTNEAVTLTATVPNVDNATISELAPVTANGSYSFTANVAGLTTDIAYSYDVDNIDTEAPVAPSITALTDYLTNEGSYLSMTGEEILWFKIGEADWTKYSGSIYMTTNADVAIKATDLAGNETPGDPITVDWIDKEAPEASSAPALKVNGGAYDGSYIVSGDVITLEMTATDNEDNLTIYTRFNDESTVVTEATNGTPFVYTIELPTVSSDTNQVQIWVYDEAGNRLDFSTDDYVTTISDIKIDVHEPVIAMNGGNQTIMLGGVYQDLGVTVYDDLDESPTVTVGGDTVDEESVASYVVTYFAVDDATNTTATLERTVHVVDTMKPMITTDLVDRTVSRSAFDFNATVADNAGNPTWSVTLNGSTETGVDGAFSVALDEGENTIVLRGVDPSNNVTEDTYTITFVRPESDRPYMVQDITVPTNETITVEIVYPDGAAIKKYAEFTLAEAAGITAIADITTWQDYTDVIAEKANKVIFAYSQQDNDSLPSEMVSLVVDNFDDTNPNDPVVTPSSSTPTNEAVEVTMNGEGIVYYQMGQVLNGNETLVNLNIYDGVITVEQNVNIYAFAVDAAGNRSDVSTLEIDNIDKVTPIGEVTYSTKVSTSSDVMVTLTVNEEYLIDNDGPRYHTFTSNDTYTFSFTDLAGNATSVSATVDNIDRTAPVVVSNSVTVNGEETSVVKGGDLVKVSYVLTDAQEVSGTVDFGNLVLGTPFRVTYNQSNDNYELEANIQVPEDYNGTVLIEVCIKDLALNKLTLTAQETMLVDNVKPIFSIRFLNDIVNDYIIDTTIVTELTKDDSTILFGDSPATMTLAIATLDATLNTVDYKDGLEHTIYMQGQDTAGNLSDIQTLSFKWDAVAPEIPTALTNVTDVTNIKEITLSGKVEAGTVKVVRGEELIFDGVAGDYAAGILVSLRPGANVLTVTNTDLAGNTSLSKSITVTLDSEAPVIDVQQADDDSIVVTTTETLENASYVLDGADPVNLVFTNNSATIPAIVGGGEHFLLITGHDAAGNEGIGRLSFITVAANEVTTEELSDGITMTEGTFTEASQLIVRTFEVDAGEDQGFVGEAINFELDGTSEVANSGVIVDIYVGTGFPTNTKLNYYDEDTTTWLPLDKDLENGDSYYNGTDATVYVAIDPANAEAITVTGNVNDVAVGSGHIVGLLRHFSGYAAIEDITPPELTIETTEPSLPTASDNFIVNADVSETATIVVTDADSTELYNQEYAEGVHSFDITLDEGENIISFVATDGADLNSPVQTFTVTKDSQLDALTTEISGVLDGVTKTKNDGTSNETLVVTDSNLDVTVTVTDANFEDVQVGDTVYTTKEVTTSVTLTEGINNLQIIATDKAGNTKTTNYSITLDTVGPEVVVTGVQEGDVLGGNVSATITGTDLDNYTAVLTNTSMSESFTDTDVIYNVPDGSKDNYTLVVDGYDENGNATRVSLDFAVDQSAPVISFNDVDNMSNNSQTVEVTVSPKEADTEIKVYKNNVRVTDITISDSIDGETKVYSFEVTETGEYTVDVNAINETSASNKSLAFGIDKDAPTINVSGVVNNQTYTTYPTIAFSGSDTVTATLNGSTIASGYKLTENGSYTLVLLSEDAATNTTSKTISFTVTVEADDNSGDTEQPVSNDPKVGSGTSTFTPTVIPTENAEIVKVTPETKELAFEETGIVFNLEKVEVPEGTEFSVEKIELEELPKSDDKKLQIAVVSQVYEFTASKTFKGKLEISIPYDPELVDQPNKLVASYYDEAKDKWVILGGRVDRVNHMVIFKTTHFSKYLVMEREKSFDDLSGFSWAVNAVNTLAARGVISGYSGNLEFRPANEITRAEFATMIVKALNLYLEDTSMSFNDIEGQWYEEMILTAASNGIMSGYQNQAMPNDLITREQMAVMVMNAYKLIMNNSLETIETQFDDGNSISNWAKKSVANAHKQGIISGKGNNKFAPTENATRAEAASMIFNLIKALKYIQ